MTATVKNPTVDVETILELPTDELNDLMQEIKHQTRVKEEEKVFAVIEEGTEQDFFYSEFDMLFTFLKN